MSEQLSERGKDLVKYMPQVVNALADRLIEKFEERLLYGEKPPTNADRIRSMTDEELADTFAHKADACWNCSSDGLDTCKECILEWLKQEISNE